MTVPKDPIKAEIYLKKLSDAKKGRPSNFKDKHLSESAKQKLRECNLGKKQSSATIEKRISKTRGENHWTFHIPRSEEQKEKQRSKMIGKNAGEKNYFFGKHLCGKDHPNWQGGSHFFPYCPKFNNSFKERVRAFFGYVCVECGTPQYSLPRKLDIHHIHYDKKMCCNGSPRDVVALCGVCNIRANTNRDYWEKHFTEIINQYYGGKCYFTKEEMQAIRSCA